MCSPQMGYKWIVKDPEKTKELCGDGSTPMNAFFLVLRWTSINPRAHPHMLSRMISKVDITKLYVGLPENWVPHSIHWFIIISLFKWPAGMPISDTAKSYIQVSYSMVAYPFFAHFPRMYTTVKSMVSNWVFSPQTHPIFGQANAQWQAGRRRPDTKEFSGGEFPHWLLMVGYLFLAV